MDLNLFHEIKRPGHIMTFSLKNVNVNNFFSIYDVYCNICIYVISLHSQGQN